MSTQYSYIPDKASYKKSLYKFFMRWKSFNWNYFNHLIARKFWHFCQVIKPRVRKFQSSISTRFCTKRHAFSSRFLLNVFCALIYLSFVKLLKNFDEGNAFETNRKSRTVKMRRWDAFSTRTRRRNYRGAS